MKSGLAGTLSPWKTTSSPSDRRSSPEDRERYEQLKRSLAEREWSDMNHYADAKGPLIEDIIARAGQTRTTRPAT